MSRFSLLDNKYQILDFYVLSTLNMMAINRRIYIALVLLRFVDEVNSKSIIHPLLGVAARTPYPIPIAEPPTPTISPTRIPTLPPALHQNANFDIKGFIFPYLHSQPVTAAPPHTSPTGSGLQSTPIVVRSVPCNLQAMGRIQLSDEALSSVLTDGGGRYVPQYMAVEETEASRNFRNMLPLNAISQDPSSHQQSKTWNWNHPLTKSEMIELLDKTHPQFYGLRSTKSGKQDATPFEIVWNKTDSQIQIRNYSAEHVQHQEVAPELDQKYKQTHNERYRPRFRRKKRVLKNRNLISNSILDQIIPAHRLYTEHERIKRDSTGAVSRIEYCTSRDQQTTDGYLHMCTTCAHTTTLSDDKFPRIINEVVCHARERGCMFVGATPHGSCHQNVMHLTMLRKKTGSCMLVIQNGAHVLTDEWELYSQPIRVSCECRIDKRSPFAKYINPN